MPLSAEAKAIIAELILAPIHSNLFEILQKLEDGSSVEAVKADLLALMRQIREDAV